MCPSNNKFVGSFLAPPFSRKRWNASLASLAPLASHRDYLHINRLEIAEEGANRGVVPLGIGYAQA